MTTTPNMLLTLPTDHDSADVWGALILTIFGQVDAHDHQPGKGVKVPSNGLNINADLSFGSNSATNVEAVDFAAASTTAVSAFAGALFLADGTGGTTANELYWRTTSGSNVKLTNGPALNVAAFAGGIGGDYVSVGAAIAFDDANKRYTLKDGTTNWARLASGEVRIFETGTTDAVFVGQAAPAALAVSYTMTWPTALPAAIGAVSVTAAGQITFDGDRVRNFHGINGNSPSTGTSPPFFWEAAIVGGVAFMSSVGGIGANLIVPVPLQVGERAKSLAVQVQGNGTVDGSITVWSLSATMVATSIGTATLTNPGAGWAVTTIALTNTTIVANASIVVEIGANATGLHIGTMGITYDRQA